MNPNIKIEPFLKWAGGKRWFVNNYSHLFPKSFDKYIEPFLGAGSVFFNLSPKRAILSDINGDLINTYKAIKDNWKLVYKKLKQHHLNHDANYYHSIRNKNPKNNYDLAARFIYLNRTCWNGLYRVNLKGKFNVPIGTKNKVLLDSDNFEIIAKRLLGAELIVEDFEKILEVASKGDFVFIDPPYTIKHQNNGFIKYNEVLFKWEDQIRLRDAVLAANSRGANILITNAHHKSVIDLYKKHFLIESVSRYSVIAASSSKRNKFNEVIIKNYELQ